MILDVDQLIRFFKKYTTTSEVEEMDEQTDAGKSASGSAGASAPSGKPVKKWETGVARSKANQIGVTKWESGRKLGKTYMNDPKYVWKSDRVMGKTGGSDFA